MSRIAFRQSYKRLSDRLNVIPPVKQIMASRQMKSIYLDRLLRTPGSALAHRASRQGEESIG
jgi:hypothetical protein